MLNLLLYNKLIYKAYNKPNIFRKAGITYMIHEVIDIAENGFKAQLTTYIVDNTVEAFKDKKRPIVIVCPGGGYERTSSKEGEPAALKLNAMGIHAAVLNYSCKPAVFPTALLQLARSIDILRTAPEDWHIDTDRIVVLGFSAGGHLTASIGAFWNKNILLKELDKSAEEIKPNALVLCYPVISSGEFAHRGSFEALLGADFDNQELSKLMSIENQVDKTFPKTFIWHTYEDDAVPMENTLLLAGAMRKNDVPFAMHVFEKGTHGRALGTMETGETVEEIQPWISMAGDWILSL